MGSFNHHNNVNGYYMEESRQSTSQESDGDLPLDHQSVSQSMVGDYINGPLASRLENLTLESSSSSSADTDTSSEMSVDLMSEDVSEIDEDDSSQIDQMHGATDHMNEQEETPSGVEDSCIQESRTSTARIEYEMSSNRVRCLQRRKQKCVWCYGWGHLRRDCPYINERRILCNTCAIRHHRKFLGCPVHSSRKRQSPLLALSFDDFEGSCDDLWGSSLRGLYIRRRSAYNAINRRYCRP